ncbi:MAG: VOC family protein [Anaerolineales bacterium]|nr:VOC family protein [Anaerolineales bacterium]
MTKIEHIALWVRDIEASRDFYVKYFGGAAGAGYTNPETDFQSFFVVFGEGARLEIMQRPDTAQAKGAASGQETTGYSHIAFSVGSKEVVNRLTHWLIKDGYYLLGGPRTTGDGYYESLILDPDGNRVEITV